jgi:hypothetical protein
LAALELDRCVLAGLLEALPRIARPAESRERLTAQRVELVLVALLP